MSALRLTGSTSGYAELTPPAIAGDQTFTLPSTGGTLDRINRAGNILQVVNVIKTGASAIASATFADIPDLSATITPASATNKILVQVSINGISIEAAVTSLNTRLLRGASVITAIDGSIGYTSLSQLYPGGVSIAYLDSPATTSATTYKVQFSTNTGNTAYVNNYTNTSSVSTITLMEVAA